MVGLDAVLAMMGGAGELTGGIFRLRPGRRPREDRHAVVLVVWTAERGGRTLRCREVTVYRAQGSQLAEAWFHPDDLLTVDAFWA